MSTTPYIHITKDLITIIGDKASFEVLGHALLLKAKMGSNYKCIINDGVNTPIKLLSFDAITDEIVDA